MHLAVIGAVFPLVFVAELPDKTMFASLVLAARGRPFAVWLGAVGAFAVHVVIAVSIGVVVFHFLPHAVVEGIVAGLFFGGAVYAYLTRDAEEQTVGTTVDGGAVRAAATALSVIFLAEWGDLTQILTANLAVRYHSPLSVGVGSLAALAAVAAVAVLGGRSLVRVLSVRTLRLVMAVALVAAGIYSVVQAVIA
jgi:putative Ca2+/H+ antiporter (TMEM165/GDT1 family)